MSGQTENNLLRIENLQKFSKCFKNQNNTELPSKRVPSHEKRWKYALFNALYIS
jgi:hypothetical protein